jgi:catechol 2,3-dioxygenase-like lactoylglutathione lyase family enzyme
VHASVGAITLFVEDVARAKEFYVRVFEVSPLFEDETSVAFKFDNTIVNLAHSSGAAELIEPVKVAAADAGTRMQLTIWVDDADATSAELARRGVELLNGPQDRPWGVRTAALSDPDGHVWEIAQQLAEG